MAKCDKSAKPDFTPRRWEKDLPRIRQGVPQGADYRQMRICPRCLELEGWYWWDGQWLYQPHPHYCAHWTKKDAKLAPPRCLDVTDVLCLCECCGSEVLAVGTKWSVWFCEECRIRTIHTNRFLGHYCIPIGRHSLQSAACGTPLGFINGHEIIKNPKKVRTIAKQLRGMFDQMDRLSEWARLAVRENTRCIGLNQEESIPLPLYVRSLKRTPIDKKIRFIQMCESMGVPWQEVYTLGYRGIVESKRPPRK